MKLTTEDYRSRPWRIHELAGDFRVEDVWALPTPGDRADFPMLVEAFTSADPSQRPGGAGRLLWMLRLWLGGLLGWDDPEAGVDSRVPSLRRRLPDDLRLGPTGPGFEALPFRPLYLLEHEFAAEIANKTMHGVLHLGWVPDASGGYTGQMTVLVKPNGLVGELYMLAIRPFRHAVVYPPMLRRLGRDWRAKKAG